MNPTNEPNMAVVAAQLLEASKVDTIGGRHWDALKAQLADPSVLFNAIDIVYPRLNTANEASGLLARTKEVLAMPFQVGGDLGAVMENSVEVILSIDEAESRKAFLGSRDFSIEVAQAVLSHQSAESVEAFLRACAHYCSKGTGGEHILNELFRGNIKVGGIREELKGELLASLWERCLKDLAEGHALSGLTTGLLMQGYPPIIQYVAETIDRDKQLVNAIATVPFMSVDERASLVERIENALANSVGRFSERIAPAEPIELDEGFYLLRSATEVPLQIESDLVQVAFYVPGDERAALVTNAQWAVQDEGDENQIRINLSKIFGVHEQAKLVAFVFLQQFELNDKKYRSACLEAAGRIVPKARVEFIPVSARQDEFRLP